MDLNELKMKYFLYRVDQACKEIERTEYKSGGSAYRHLQKAQIRMKYLPMKK